MEMDIKVVFDSNTIDNRFSKGWGVSYLVNDKILFDTGQKGRWLVKNIKTLGVGIDKLQSVVISHDHWDHTGGLWELLKRKQVKVYACPHFSREFKEKVKGLKGELIEADRFVEIAKNIFVTGELPGAYNGKYMPEQALAIKTQNGITIMTGCAHPGIVKILEKVRGNFPEERFYLVFGGFHLRDKKKNTIEEVVRKFKEMNVKKVGPTHCSGKKAGGLFKKKYGKNFVIIKTGRTLKV